MTYRGNTKTRNNQHKPVPNVPAEPGSDPILSNSSSSESSDSSDDKYYRWRRRGKKNKINSGLKHVSITQPKSAQNLQPSYWQPCTNQRSLGSNWTRIHYIAGFISYHSWDHLKLYYNNSQKHTCYLQDIHPQEGKKYQIMLKRPHGHFCMHI